jgi:hypothetical protein
MSHTVADGYTYYAILNMLASGVEPYAMVVTRDDSLRDSYPEQVGKGEYDRMLNPDLCTICKYIGAAMTAKSNPPLVRLVDKAKLAEMKESARSEDGAAAFVSTNDIITAGFARAVNAREITMAMDFRGRVEGLTKEHAGCYHFGLVYVFILLYYCSSFLFLFVASLSLSFSLSLIHLLLRACIL